MKFNDLYSFFSKLTGLKPKQKCNKHNYMTNILYDY